MRSTRPREATLAEPVDREVDRHAEPEFRHVDRRDHRLSSSVPRSTTVTTGVSKSTFSPAWTCRLATMPDSGAVSDGVLQRVAGDLDLRLGGLHAAPRDVEARLGVVERVLRNEVLLEQRLVGRPGSSRPAPAAHAPIRARPAARSAAPRGRRCRCVRCTWPALTSSPSRTVSCADFAGDLGLDHGRRDGCTRPRRAASDRATSPRPARGRSARTQRHRGSPLPGPPSPRPPPCRCAAGHRDADARGDQQHDKCADDAAPRQIHGHPCSPLPARTQRVGQDRSDAARKARRGGADAASGRGAAVWMRQTGIPDSAKAASLRAPCPAPCDKAARATDRRRHGADGPAAPAAAARRPTRGGPQRHGGPRRPAPSAGADASSRAMD